MDSGLKGLLIGCCVLIVVGVAVIAGIFFYIRSHKDAIVAEVKELHSDGLRFGKDVAEPRCVDEAMSRYRSNAGMFGSVRTSLWLGGCLDTSALDSGFCADVPPENEMIRTGQWRAARCSAHGFAGDASCPNIFSTVQKYCGSPGRARKAAAERGTQ